jgi:hypothetical protein
MREETTTRTLYTFAELSEDAQNAALEKLHDINVDCDWYDLDYHAENLAAIGFENAKIHFSGFWSQGDGACFDADVNVEKALNAFLMCNHPARNFDVAAYEKWLTLAERGAISAHIRKVGPYNIYAHANTRDLELDCVFSQKAWDKLGLGACQDLLEQLRHDACQEIYSSLEKEYEYLTGRGAILGTIEANEYEFTEDGRLA